MTKIKNAAGRAGRFARRNALPIVAAGVAAAGVAGAEDTAGTFSFDYTGLAKTVGAVILSAAAAGATLKATGISVKAAFKWAERLLRG